MNKCIIPAILIVFIASLGINNLQAQKHISIHDKSKQTTLKSTGETPPLPPGMLEGIESYSEFSLNPQLRSTDISIGDQLDFFCRYITFTGTVINIEEYIDGVVGVTAKLNDYEIAYGYMAISPNGVTTLFVHIPETDQIFTVTQNNARYYVLKHDPAYQGKPAILKTAEDIDITDKTLETVEVTPRLQPSTKSLSRSSTEDEATLRLMYAFTKQAAEKWTERYPEALGHQITISLLVTQLIMDNSKTGVNLELAKIHVMDYDDRTYVETMLNWAIRNDRPDIMGEIPTIKDSEDIDIVIISVKQPVMPAPTAGGVAVALDSKMGDRHKNGFVIIDENGLYDKTNTLAHELGHTFGCHHHKDQSYNPAPSYRLFKYGTSWRGTIFDDLYKYTTALGYTQFPGSSEYYRAIPYYSSPDISINGVIIGDAEFSDNARVIRENKATAATYGKGMRIYIEDRTIDYGLSIDVRSTMYKHRFELRNGDKVVYTREPGTDIGKYAVSAYIEDDEGSDVTDDPYYKGNLYIYSGIYEIIPRTLNSSGIYVKPKVYDGTTKAFIDFSRLYTSDYGSSGIDEEDMNDVTFDTSDFFAVYPDANVGNMKRVTSTGTVKITGAKGYCYQLPAITAFMSAITAAPLTITAKNLEINLGTDPGTINLSNAYTITGLVNGETESVLNGSLTISIDPSITSSSPAGIYKDAIKIKGYTANNYDITYVSGDLSIKRVEDSTLTGLVTIGALEPASAGALLQLKNIENIKDGEANSNKGLLLPRVRLTEQKKLYPMFDPGYNPTLEETHIGLVVFNTNDDPLKNLFIGIYVWNGKEWEKLH